MASEEVSKYFYEWSKQQIQDDIKVDNLPEGIHIILTTLFVCKIAVWYDNGGLFVFLPVAGNFMPIIRR